MRCATWVVAASLVAAIGACSLTTSLEGFTNGDVSAPTEAGATDAPSGGDAMPGNEGGPMAEGGTTDGGADAGVEGGALDYRAVVLGDAPVAYYRLGDIGTTAKDETGAHDGVYKGLVTHAAGALARDTNGAAVFDGATGYVDVGDVLPFTGRAPFTVEAWASPIGGATDPACLVAKSIAPGGAAGGLADGYTFYLDNSTQLTNFARYRSSSSDTLTGPALALASYTHVVATYDGTTMSIWLNGALATSTASTRSLAAVANPLVIGAGRGGIFCFFKGALDEVAFYDVALSDTRIRAHYQAGK